MQKIGYTGMMRILFVNPPFLAAYGKFSREQRSPAITKSGTFYYPMWLSYAVGYAQAQGHEVLLLDAPADRLTEGDLTKKAGSFDPGVIVISTSTPSIYNDMACAASLKGQIGSPFVLLVGVHVSALPVESLKHNDAVDGVAVGEYELTVSELALKIEAKESLDDVKGLVYRNTENGQIRVNAPREPIRDFDSIPWVSRIYGQFLNFKNYFYSGNLYPLVVFNTSRGCPHGCSFCVYPQVFSGHQFRCRTVRDVVDEMDYVSRSFSPLGEIMFEDDTFTINEKRVRELCEEILRRNLRVRWSCNARVELQLETMKLMKKAGCRSLLVGFESGSQDVLNGMKKGNQLAVYKLFMDDTRKAGLLVNGTFLVGCPGETRDTMRTTLELAKDLNPDVAQFFPVMVYPGTAMYDDYKSKGHLVSGNFRDWINEQGMHNCVVDLPGVRAKEMVQFCDKCRKAFYLRPKYISYKAVQAMRHPREGVRTAKAARTFFKPLFFGTKLT